MDELIYFSKNKELKSFPLDKFPDWKDIRVGVCLGAPRWLYDTLNADMISYSKIPFGGQDCHVFHNEFLIFEDGKKSWSSSSGAIYLGRSLDKRDGLLLQYIPPNSKTSKHYHISKREIFTNLLGVCTVHVDGTPIALEKRQLCVEPMRVHQVETLGSHALNLLEILGDPKGISLDDHQYVDD